MEMPNFEKFRYLVVKDPNPARFSACWILAKGRLVEAPANDINALSRSLERIKFPEQIGLNYFSSRALDVYRIARSMILGAPSPPR